MEPKPNFSPTQMAQRSPTTGAITALVLASALGNVGGTILFWDLPYGRFAEFVICFALGLLAAQPCALAVWCALGGQKLVVRVPLTMGILFGLVCVFTGTLYAMDSNMPMEVPLVLVVISFLCASLIQTPLWIFRLKTGCEISLMGIKTDSEEGSQFGIKHLMITTAIAAVAVAAFQFAFKNGEFEGAPWGEIIGFFMTFELYVSILTLLSVAFVFSGLNRIGIGMLLGGVVVLGPLAVQAIVSAVTPGSGAGMLFNIYGFTIALTTAVTTVLLAFHGMGYRLQRSRP